MAERNQQMFNDIAALVERDNGLHMQSTWTNGPVRLRRVPVEAGHKVVSCGTNQCIAGWAVALSDEYKIKEGTPVNKETGEFVDWVSAGADILGLNEFEARRLFRGTNGNIHNRIPMDWPDALRAIGAGIEVTTALTQEVPRCEETNE
jgi:hypothetical protein